MTGEEFKQMVSLYGTQAAVANALGVDADTIRARYKDPVVPSLYEHAINGLVLSAKLPPIPELVELAGTMQGKVNEIISLAGVMQKKIAESNGK